MKRPLQLFLFSLVVLTILFALNQWNLPIVMWLATVFGIVALLSGTYLIVMLLS